MTQQQLDTRGLICPMPVIKVQDMIKTLHQGDILEVRCSDPGTMHDVPAWCRIHGHEILQCSNNDEEILIRIKVGPDGT
ncbi:MAG TPA: sulfurtransferase TusA family protein [Acidiferrobacteraceae bacterium]|nr:sulfurtransferase TusA family protein [Acidiferrobacteraceae bacterium]HEX20402.1 sulfurtransferase TusA family protein [Acidiferrobacteraceae bacterium]